MDPHYAESVAISGLSRDLRQSFSVRLGRFPRTGMGSLWISADIDGDHYAVAEQGLELTTAGATPSDAEATEFAVAGSASARFSSAHRHGSDMHGTVSARGMAHRAEHPPPGPGILPISVHAGIRVAHAPVRVRPGRIEVMGSVRAVVTVDGREHRFDVPGKWHEQVGPRPRFAPAFTYLFVQGDGIGIMATKHADGAWGYVLQDNATTTVTAMDIDPYGPTQRRFAVTLADGRSISGTAHVKRETSVPIEGRRRPGATVVVESDIGTMVGTLNDWNPEGASD